jgi:uncharacterized phage protein gp47/JayE
MFEDITPESIKADILADITAANMREGSYTNNLVSPVATELQKVYDGMNSVVPMVYIDETSGEYIDKKCAERGIPRKAGTKAHTDLSLTGTDGTVIPAGTVFLTLDGLEYESSASATVSSGTAIITVNAVEVGENYNVQAGSIVNQYTNISGLSAVTNAAAAIGGTDPEIDASLVARYYAYLQKPATSGNIRHYEQWALKVDGVGAVKVTPLANGPGTVGVLIVGPTKQPVSSDIVTNCADYIEENRPIGAEVTVTSASGLAINVTATVTISGITTKAAVQSAFAAAPDTYLKSIAFSTYTFVRSSTSVSEQTMILHPPASTVRLSASRCSASVQSVVQPFGTGNVFSGVADTASRSLCCQ